MRFPFLSRTVVLCLDLSLHTIFLSPWSIWLVILFGEYPCCFVYILMREESVCDTKRTCNKYYKNSKGNKFIKFRKRKGKKGLKKLAKFRKNRKGNNIYIYILEVGKKTTLSLIYIYTYIFLLFKILSKKYRKNSKNNKFNKILDLERKKTKEQPQKVRKFWKKSQKQQEYFFVILHKSELLRKLLYCVIC